mmetsp:Transcript_43757/g.74699  ORF Transcript_43757/g.74699 Transcript_43757/m.74699 type:complete len:402 (+) Transcript_43757:108-1313(+)
MAALTRATKANYVIHDRIEAETSDREDHTFCGIMFPVKCKDTLPVDHVIINSVAVRGALGPITVWVTKDENLNGEISMAKKNWTKIYEKEHAPSFVGYKELDLSTNPVIMKPGSVRGIYIHSSRRGDEAIVYDNKVKQKTHDDSFITILPGRAHVSEKVFGAIPIWGWGSAWRDNREFVGQIKYGACYRLWNPSKNLSFGGNFRCAARTLFMCQRRQESPFSKLPDDCLFYILHMMRWDWVDDTSGDLRREQKYRRKLRRQQMIAEADAMLDEAEMEEAENTADSAPAVNEQDDEAVLGIDDDDYVEYENMDEDSSDDSEDADSSDDDSISEESAASDEHAYAWGDHVNSRNRFIFNDSDSSDSDDDASDEHVDERLGRPRRSQFTRATRNLLHFRFLRSH